ncbi:C3a anaphylatoxin chemotactic receptor [Chanos chanos]|uniref:C3a anaphylatoxin chemotactic receptor n=1 Tax=Chanos chanos TaxID=29144 RepID=A0A6J2UV20_CHACN|nr:C3a anaphylatoxin chemotactic receptor-like [Chanos chanos]
MEDSDNHVDYFNYTNESEDSNFSYYESYYNGTDDTAGPRDVIKKVSLALYFLTCLLGVPGNAAVVWIAGCKMRRTVNTIWFVNLAVADLFCCLSIPFSVVEIFLDHHWPYGNAMCKVLSSVIIINMFASVFTLTLISLDRFALVIKPVWAQNHRKLSLAWILCGVAWMLSLGLSLPTMILKGTRSDEFFNVTLCTYHHDSDAYSYYDEDQTPDRSALKTIGTIRFVFGFLFPLITITVCYAFIAQRLRASRFRSDKAFRIMLAVVVTFFLCWVPYHVAGLVQDYGEEQISQVAFMLDPLALSLAYINSCLNPVLYVFMGQDFKSQVRLSLRRVFENAFSEGTTNTTVHTKGQKCSASNSSAMQLQYVTSHQTHSF